MPNYKLGKIYKIVDNTNNECYIGSTCERTLARRLAGHVKDHRKYLTNSNNKSVTSFRILANNNYDIILIESYPCNTKDELHRRERYYIEHSECVNKVIPGRTMQEYRQYNKEKKKADDKKYWEVHKEELKQKCDCPYCGMTYIKHNKTQHMNSYNHKHFSAYYRQLDFEKLLKLHELIGELKAIREINRYV